MIRIPVIHLPEDVHEILLLLEQQGYEAYVVGGCVRDSLLGVEPKDWDICTNATPDQIVSLFGEENTIPTGIKHGTVTVKHNGNLFEVTTYRVDGKYSDSRHPDSVQFTANLNEDLVRRDFTINAMAYNPKSGIVDPYGGQWSLQIDCLIEAVGIKDSRFKEDPLRILRAIRFSATLGFPIETETYVAMINNLSCLDKISMERIGSEVMKIVSAPYAHEAICQNDNGKIFRYIIPELDQELACSQNNKYHYTDVFHHTMDALKNASTQHVFPDEWADEYVKMALLLHDVGKPASKTTDDDGHDHFYGHAKFSAKIAEQILRRLRYSNQFIDTVVELIANHDVEFVPTKPCARRLLNRLGVDQVHHLLKLRECDNRAHTHNAFAKFKNMTIPFSKILEEVIQDEGSLKVKDLAIDGMDIINMGCKSGPMIGAALKHLLNEVIKERVQNNKEDLVKECKCFLGI